MEAFTGSTHTSNAAKISRYQQQPHLIGNNSDSIMIIKCTMEIDRNDNVKLMIK